jgi:hypothetical protein
MRYISKNKCYFYKDRTHIIIQASFKTNKTSNTLTLTNISFQWYLGIEKIVATDSLTLVTFVVRAHDIWEEKFVRFFHMIERRRNSTRFKNFYVWLTYCKSLITHCESFLVTYVSIYLTTISVIFWTLLESNFSIDSYL